MGDIWSNSPQLSAGKNCRLSNWDEKGSVTVHPGNYGVFCIQIDKETAPKLPDVTLGMPCLRRECATFWGECVLRLYNWESDVWFHILLLQQIHNPLLLPYQEILDN